MITDLKISQFYHELHDIIKQSPGTAYRYYDEVHTYKEMYDLMVRFNRVLSGYKNRHIVQYSSKKFPSYAAIFSIILSKNTWLPLSFDNPDQRNLEILKQTDPVLVFYDRELPQALSEYFADNGVKCISIDEIISEDEQTEFDLNGFSKDHIAYIMFTSGSTGTPKGVPMSHENYANFVHNVMKILPFEENEVFSDFHDFAFDISSFYLFAWIFSKGIISPIQADKDRIIPINHIIENEITVWSSVPSVINRIKAFRPNDQIETRIKVMFLCGEPLKFDVLKYCFENMSLKNVYNFYGLTETGVENFYHKCSPSDPEVFGDFGMAPIGKPLPGNEVKISAEKELCISGCQVTPGYLGGISADKFETIDNKRWYKTGDIAQEYDGYYFCKGRLDAQVKLSGYRVDLMDIEAHIARGKNVEQVVCFVCEKAGRSLLVAAIKPEGDIDFRQIQDRLSHDLPPYMIPKKHIILDTFPLNTNGKVDRKKIKAIYLES